jgi:Domain of unknown function (DUF4349)
MRKLIPALAMMIVIAACGGAQTAETFSEIGSGLDGKGQPVSQFGPGDEEVQPPTTVQGGNVDVQIDTVVDRKVIRQATLELEADDTRSTYDRLIAIAQAAGGFVANATVYPVQSEDESPQVTLVLRVPSDQLSAVMTEIKEAADEVVTESQAANDVTEQYVDLEARLTNLTALEIELRALLEEVRQQPDADPDKLLRVYTEISNTRGQIEEIQGQINYLDDVVDLATIDITLSPTPAAVPIVDDEWKPVEVAREALRSLVSGLQVAADWGINFAIYVLPMLLIGLGIPLLVGFGAFRWWRRRHPSSVVPATVES